MRPGPVKTGRKLLRSITKSSHAFLFDAWRRRVRWSSGAFEVIEPDAKKFARPVPWGGRSRNGLLLPDG